MTGGLTDANLIHTQILDTVVSTLRLHGYVQPSRPLIERYYVLVSERWNTESSVQARPWGFTQFLQSDVQEGTTDGLYSFYQSIYRKVTDPAYPSVSLMQLTLDDSSIHIVTDFQLAQLKRIGANGTIYPADEATALTEVGTIVNRIRHYMTQQGIVFGTRKSCHDGDGYAA